MKVPREESGSGREAATHISEIKSGWRMETQQHQGDPRRPARRPHGCGENTGRLLPEPPRAAAPAGHSTTQRWCLGDPSRRKPLESVQSNTGLGFRRSPDSKGGIRGVLPPNTPKIIIIIK